MAHQGLFGEIIHAEGAYIHALQGFWDRYHENWRLNFQRNRRGDVYPTHGLGPVAQVMGINRGDRFDYLTSMSTNQFGCTLYAEKKFGKD